MPIQRLQWTWLASETEMAPTAIVILVYKTRLFRPPTNEQQLQRERNGTVSICELHALDTCSFLVKLIQFMLNKCSFNNNYTMGWDESCDEARAGKRVRGNYVNIWATTAFALEMLLMVRFPANTATCVTHARVMQSTEECLCLGHDGQREKMRKVFDDAFTHPETSKWMSYWSQ